MASVWIPAGAVRSMDPKGDGVVCALVALRAEAVDSWWEDDSDPRAHRKMRAAVNLNCFTRTGMPLAVRDLHDRVVLALPTNRSVDVKCMFWNETLGKWSSEGMEEVMSADGHLTCATSHLTLFGGIARGVVETLRCTNYDLLSFHGVQQLFVGQWYSTNVGVAFWIVMFQLLFMMGAACAADRSRMVRGHHGDEQFLIPQRSGSVLFISESTEQGCESEEADINASSCALSCPCQCHKESSAIRDALDDLASRFFDHFSELRALLESTWQGLQVVVARTETDDHGLVWRVAQSALSALLTGAARRQASAALLISEDVVQLVTENDQVGEFLRHAASAGARTHRAPDAHFDEVVQMWDELHETVLDCIDHHWHQNAKLCSIPVVALQIFFISNPIVSPFLGCYMWTSSLRVLFLAAEFFGSALVTTIFFQAAMPSRRKARGDCGELTEFGPLLGRIIVIGVASALFAGLPVWLLAQLHDRTFKQVTTRGCPEWRKQLRIWRVQDNILWTIGLAYTAFCAFFVALFLANTLPEDLPAWATSVAISLAQDLLVIPLTLALCVTIVMTVLLSILSLIKGVDRRTTVQHHRNFVSRSGSGNWERQSWRSLSSPIVAV